MSGRDALRHILTPSDQALVSPILSINGSGRDALLTGYIEAIDALRVAQAKVNALGPHGRDYPSTDILMMAQVQHRLRQIAIDVIIDDLNTIALSVAEAIG